MLLTAIALRVYFYLQLVFPMPFKVDKNSGVFTRNKNYSQKRRFLWFPETFGVLSAMVYGFSLLYLILNWKNFTVFNIDIFVINCLLTAASSIGIITGVTLQCKASQIDCIFNGLLRLTSLYQTRTISSTTQRAIDMITGVILVPVMLFPIIVGISPFKFSHDPFQMFLGKTIYVKVLAMTVFSSTFYYLPTSFFAILSFSVAYLDRITVFSKSLVASVSKSSESHDSALAGAPKSIQKRFQLSYRRHTIIVLIMDRFNESFSVFYAGLIMIGVLLATCCTYAILKMFGKVINAVYFMFTWTVIVCFTVALGFTYWAGLTCIHSRKSISYWKVYATRKETKKLLQAILVRGFDTGPYGVACAKLGLMICDDIIRNSVTLLLLS